MLTSTVEAEKKLHMLTTFRDVAAMGVDEKVVEASRMAAIRA